ncbi:DUF1707 SHOCT-like domain-containing protein [Flindersiella endophytica]
MSWESYTRKLVSRIGDEERHKVAELLGDHLAHGRLTQEEFEERLAAAFEARTAGELGKLLADLPAVRRDQNQRQPVPRKRDDDRPWVLQVDIRKPLVVGGAFGALFIIAYVVGELLFDGGGVAAWITGLIGLGLGWLVAYLLPKLDD